VRSLSVHHEMNPAHGAPGDKSEPPRCSELT
jgi:hypothetical protein